MRARLLPEVRPLFEEAPRENPERTEILIRALTQSNHCQQYREVKEYVAQERELDITRERSPHAQAATPRKFVATIRSC